MLEFTWNGEKVTAEASLYPRPCVIVDGFGFVFVDALSKVCAAGGEISSVVCVAIG